VHSAGRRYQLRERLREIAREKTGWLLTFLRLSHPLEADIEIRRLLERDPELSSLSGNDLRLLIDVWAGRGDFELLEEYLGRHPEWRTSAWRPLAGGYARRKRFQEAWELAYGHSERPVLPPEPRKELAQLRLDYHRDPAGFGPGYALARGLERNGEIDSALEVLEVLTTDASAPKYLFFVKAELWARKGDWERAWRGMERYLAPR
jgi:hypothetical protein